VRYARDTAIVQDTCKPLHNNRASVYSMVHPLSNRKEKRKSQGVCFRTFFFVVVDAPAPAPIAFTWRGTVTFTPKLCVRFLCSFTLYGIGLGVVMSCDSLRETC